MPQCLAIICFVWISACAAVAEARQPEVQTQWIRYSHGDAKLHGYLAWPTALADVGQASAKVPGVLIVHEWWGLNEYAKRRARAVAVLGYVAFALDMYGTGNVTSDRKQAEKWSGALYHDRPLLRAHAAAGLQVLSRTGRM